MGVQDWFIGWVGSKLDDVDLNFNKRYSTQGDIIFINQTNYLSQANSGVYVEGTFVRTVTPEMSARFNDSGGMGYLDPLTNRFKSAPIGKKLQVDHILPTKVIVRLKGFEKLTKTQMESILQDTIGIGNLQPLPASLNQSKGAKLDWSSFKKQNINPVYAADLETLQRQIRGDIERQIATYQRLNKQ